MNVIDKRKTYYRFDELQGGDVFRMSNNLYMKVKSYTDKQEAILLTGHSPGITVYPKNKEKVELIRNANIVILDEVYEENFISKRTNDAILNAFCNGTLLDKIRAELHATAELHEDGDYYLRDEWIDEIFDEYTKEGD